ncbi:MAG TPA: peptidase M38, partial [Achromobacter sp.]|nr:peptidase M38 [Achromobacter sp.]
MASVLFKNANLLDPLQADLLEGHHVLVEDGVIKEVSDKPLSSASAQVIDAAGRTLMPGLID